MAKRRKRKGGFETPTSDCVLLCDDVYVSQGRHKHNLIGIVGVIIAPSLPAMIGGYVCYVRLRNVYGGGQKVTLRLSNASNNEPIMETSIPFPNDSDPLGVYTVVSPLPPFPITEPGHYLFGAYHHGIPIAETPILIQTPTEQDKPT